MHAVTKMIKNTHRHPVNRVLHCIGAPFYVIGLATALGYFAGMQTELAPGIAMWIGAIALFVVGHVIEGNIRSTTPVLLVRLLSKVAHNFVAQRVHFFRA